MIFEKNIWNIGKVYSGVFRLFKYRLYGKMEERLLIFDVFMDGSS